MKKQNKLVLNFFILLVIIIVADYIYYIPFVAKVLFSLIYLSLLYFSYTHKTKKLIVTLLGAALLFDSRPRDIYSNIDFFSWGSDFLFGFSLSLLVIIPIIIYILREKSFKEKIIKNKYFAIISFLLFWASLIGIKNAIQGGIYLKYSIIDFVKLLYLIIYFVFAYIVLQKISSNYIVKLIIYFTVVKLVSGIILLLLGRFAYVSGGILTFSNSSVQYYILLGLFFYYIYKSKYIKSLLVISLYAFYLITYFQRAFFIVTIFQLFFIPTYYIFTKWNMKKLIHKLLLFFKPKYIISLMLIITLSFIFINNKINISEKYVNIKSIVSEIDNINIIEDKKAPRVVEFININKKNFENPIAFLFGQGIGGYFKQKYAKYRSWQMTESAFSKAERKEDSFFNPHSFFNVILLKFGIIGFLLYIILFLLVLYKINVKFNCLEEITRFSLISSILWLALTFYMNTSTVLIHSFYYAIFFSEINKKFKLN